MEQEDLIKSIETGVSESQQPVQVQPQQQAPVQPLPQQTHQPARKRSFFDVLTLISYIILGVVGIVIVVLLLIG